GEEELRIAREGARNGDALLLAAGKLLRIVMPAPFQADALEPLPGYLVGVWIAGELQRKHDVLQCGQRRQELKRLEHETEQTLPQRGARILVETAERRAGEAHVTPRGPVEPGKQAEQRRLARSGRADDGDCLSRGDIEAD